MVQVKVFYLGENQTRRFRVVNNYLTLRQFTQTLSDKTSQFFNRTVLPQDIIFQYQDNEGDWIDVSTEEEWDEALRICSNSLKIKLHENRCSTLHRYSAPEENEFKETKQNEEEELRQRLEELHVISPSQSSSALPENKPTENQDSVHSDEAVIGEHQQQEEKEELEQELIQEKEKEEEEYQFEERPREFNPSQGLNTQIDDGDIDNESWEKVSYTDADNDTQEDENTQRNTEFQQNEEKNEENDEENFTECVEPEIDLTRQNDQQERNEINIQQEPLMNENINNESDRTKVELNNTTLNNDNNDDINNNNMVNNDNNNDDKSLSYEDQEKKLNLIRGIIEGSADMPQGHKLEKHCRQLIDRARTQMHASFIPELDELEAKIGSIHVHHEEPEPFKYQSQLDQLQEMGFTDTELLKQLLERYDGEIEQVISFIN
eukprot:gb/GECH01011335.1/.p1 GENE.gb/GECH01011335.1/~~gb/GECH01011335.1/.p1  ORF type:complete len:434 (+),score=169.05 gb/GECH01011335.1/:1-1302(+)